MLSSDLRCHGKPGHSRGRNKGFYNILSVACCFTLGERDGAGLRSLFRVDGQQVCFCDSIVAGDLSTSLLVSVAVSV